MPRGKSKNWPSVSFGSTSPNSPRSGIRSKAENGRPRSRLSRALKRRSGPWEITDSLQSGRRRMSDSRVPSARSGAEQSASLLGSARSAFSCHDGRCHISCKVVGDPSDPMTTQRTAIFKPLGLELTRQMEAVMGRTREDAGSVDLPPRPPETKEVIESKRIPCERCGTVVAMLIFAPNATDAGHLEDYARKMYPHYNHLNVPTWIILSVDELSQSMIFRRFDQG